MGSTNRMATKEELSRLFQQAGLVYFDVAPLEQTSITDLDDRKLHEYWFTYYSINYLELEQEEQKRLLRNADILGLLEGEETVTVGGMLLSGKDPQRRISQSFVTFAVFDGLLRRMNCWTNKTLAGHFLNSFSRLMRSPAFSYPNLQP